jgi:hypothetical protein
MATRSLIGKLNSDRTVTHIYCHWDGYPSHNGVLLQEYWNTPYKVDQLLALGDLSSLGSEIGEQQDFNGFRNRDWCMTYGRDRNQSNTGAKTVSREDFFGDGDYIDYFYLYNEDFEWECYHSGMEEPYQVEIPSEYVI